MIFYPKKKCLILSPQRWFSTQRKNVLHLPSNNQFFKQKKSPHLLDKTEKNLSKEKISYACSNKKIFQTRNLIVFVPRESQFLIIIQKTKTNLQGKNFLCLSNQTSYTRRRNKLFCRPPHFRSVSKAALLYLFYLF